MSEWNCGTDKPCNCLSCTDPYLIVVIADEDMDCIFWEYEEA